jgi:tetratricopeptide (TPR) repeat protein
VTVTKQMPPASLMPFARGAGQPAARPYTGVDLLDPRPGLLKPAVGPVIGKRPEPPRKTREDIARMYEFARTSAAMSFHQLAIETLEEIVRLEPGHANAWRDYANWLRLSGRDEEADKALARAAEGEAWPVERVDKAIAKLERDDVKIYEHLCTLPDNTQRLQWLRDRLFEDPLDVVAMRHLANLEHQSDDPTTALNTLRRALELSPGFLLARRDYAQMLSVSRDQAAAFAETEIILAETPRDLQMRQLRADMALFLEKFDVAQACLEDVLKEEPENVTALNSYGALMKALGRREEAERAYRKLLSVQPNCGNGYLGLSDLRSDRLNGEDVAVMMHHLAEGIPDIVSRKSMAYALAQTLERMKEYEAAFEAYAFAAKTCKEEVEIERRPHDPEKFASRMARCRAVYTAELMRRLQKPPENPETTPIFVLGMPRAGSTLVEQILGSHTLVEATRELPAVGNVTKRIAMSRMLVEPDVFPERVPEFNDEKLLALGEEILQGIAVFRHTEKPFVVDKRPWNWMDVPFLALALPQAKFIDIRRAPMSAGFAMFKQLLPHDAAFTYDLTHLGHYYRTYVDQMAYYDSIMPGRVLRVRYEDLVDNTDAEIRRMLEYCGLPFDERCLRFWETDRAVLTPSAEQVRKPIYRGAKEVWKNFEPWLGELKEALGDLAEA